MDKPTAALNNGTDEDGQAYYYQYNLSTPVGPAGDREQYAFIYNRNIVYPASSPRIYSEPHGDVFKWDPHMPVFRAHEGTGGILFINIHADPNQTAEEIDESATAIEHVKNVYTGRLNMTILRNIYADEPYYGNTTTESPLKSDGFYWATTDKCLSAIDGKAYDKIIVTTRSRISGSVQKAFSISQKNSAFFMISETRKTDRSRNGRPTFKASDLKF